MYCTIPMGNDAAQEYRCQYCNDYFRTRDLTLDHVVPRCRGGHLNWENAVTCCTRCNGKKGSLGLGEIQSRWGMKLRTAPRIPTQYQLAMAASRMLPRRVHPTWEPYLPDPTKHRRTTNEPEEGTTSSSTSMSQPQHDLQLLMDA